MPLRGLVLLTALAAGRAGAQDNAIIDIHGLVTEVGPNLGLAGAEVTIFEFVEADLSGLSGRDARPRQVRTVLATTATDTHGEFLFHPARFGDYYVEVKKPGYLASISYNGPSDPLPESTGTLVSVSAERRSQEVRFALMQPSELTGTAIDENDKPIAGLLVLVSRVGSSLLGDVTAVTDKDGSFTAKKLIPGQYLVRMSPRLSDAVTVMPQFSEDDLKAVDQTLETIYWPGSPDERSATPVRVDPGAPATLGTIRMRKTEAHRARVSMAGCQSDDLPRFDVEKAGGGPVIVLNDHGNPQSFAGLTVASCEDFLVRGLKPGSYTFQLSSKRGWAAASEEVTNKNLEISFTMSPGVNVTGRVVPGEDVALPPLDKLKVELTVLTETGVRVKSVLASLNAKGEFGARDLRGSSHRVQVNGLSNIYYVKEIRVDGHAEPDGIVTLHEGSKLEIVLDDQPAAIGGSVTDGDKPFSRPLVFVAKWPSLDVTPRPVTGDNDGRFQITGLAPGEYRVLAVQSELADGQQIGAQMLNRLWSSAEKVTLERGGSQSVSLKLSDLMR